MCVGGGGGYVIAAFSNSISKVQSFSISDISNRISLRSHGIVFSFNDCLLFIRLAKFVIFLLACRKILHRD